jgi:hypothetical protein
VSRVTSLSASGFYNETLDSVMNPAEPRHAINPWIVTLAVMLATFMEILDTTVVNVAVPPSSSLCPDGSPTASAAAAFCSPVSWDSP